jgi:hypothetical protein
MPFQLPHQDPTIGFYVLKSVPSPQHGQHFEKRATKGPELRSFQPGPDRQQPVDQSSSGAVGRP